MVGWVRAILLQSVPMYDHDPLPALNAMRMSASFAPKLRTRLAMLRPVHSRATTSTRSRRLASPWRNAIGIIAPVVHLYAFSDAALSKPWARRRTGHMQKY